jgi:hypothetical protein
MVDVRALRESLGWARACLELQLGRQLVLVIVLDVVLLGFGALSAMASPDAPGPLLYVGSCLVPLFALGVAALADLVALERRAGCLELALAAPSGELYFLRRVGVVVAVLLVQGTMVMTLGWLATDAEFPLLTVLTQLAAVTLFTGAVAVFWAVRLASAGGVWLAAIATVFAAGRWTLWVPVVTPQPGGPRIGKLLPDPWGVWEWAAHTIPLLIAASLLVLYARRRLRRPESILAAG